MSDLEPAPSGIIVRQATWGEMTDVAKLIIETFEEPPAWYDMWSWLEVSRTERNLTRRLRRPPRGHTVIVGTIPRGQNAPCKIVACVEIGQLPAPRGFGSWRAAAAGLDPDGDVGVDDQDGAGGLDDCGSASGGEGGIHGARAAFEAAGVSTESSFPHLANLCVASNMRRMGVGREMVRFAVDLLQREGHECVFTHASNTQSAALFEGCEFSRMEGLETTTSQTSRVFHCRQLN